MSLANLHRRAGLINQARTSLADVYQRFTEGFATADLKAAQHLIGTAKRMS
jgi:hypothetical protein